jgi:nucleolin
MALMLSLKRSFYMQSFLRTSTLFVGNLSFAVDEQLLKETFSKVGPVTEVRLIRDKVEGKSKGFGYVEFEDASIADQALALSGTDILGRPIRVDMAVGIRRQASEGFGKSQGEIPLREESRGLYLANLNFSTTEDALRDICPNVQNVFFMTDRATGSFKGVAFLHFKTVEEAKEALSLLQNRELDGRTLRVNFAQFRKREESANTTEEPAAAAMNADSAQ